MQYKITLYPLERFFFGGDQTFGEGDARNYFASSTFFPQQSALLGMIRYQLLFQNDLLDNSGRVINTENRADDLIGKTGFSTKKIERDSVNFGAIEGISPVFISTPDGNYLTQAMEFGSKDLEDEINGKKFSRIEHLRFGIKPGLAMVNGFRKEIPGYDNFDAKTEIPALLVNMVNGRMRRFLYDNSIEDDPMNGIFAEHVKPGNRKEGNPKEDGFFKQLGYLMLPRCGFTFFLQLSDKIPYRFSDEQVFLGASRSMFQMNVERITDQNFETLTKQPFFLPKINFDRIVLLSDAFVQEEGVHALYTSALFYHARMIPFKHQVTDNSMTKYNKPYLVPNQFYLIEKGSVFYFNAQSESEKVKTVLTVGFAKKIGYNNYKFIQNGCN